MLISHRYKFIFIKTKKTAGTSIEIALSRYLGPDDVITHISPEDEVLRAAPEYRGPQRFFVPWRSVSLAEWEQWLRTRQRPYFYNHMPARDIRARLPANIWNSYFKFCLERNPWDKVVSWYFWEHKSMPRPSLSEFIRAGRAAELATEGGGGLYTIDGQVAVDSIYRYEALEQAMADLAARVGLPEVPRLPRAKSRFRTDRRPFQELYDPEARELVAAAFAREIALLDYRFEPG